MDELLVETGDYEYRKNVPLRKWKYNMFFVNQEYKQYRFRRGRFLTPEFILDGKCYKKRYINELQNFLYDRGYNSRQRIYNTTASKDYIKKLFFKVNDGMEFAKEVLRSHYDLGFNKMSIENKTTIMTNFLQLINSVIISLREVNSEEWARDENGRKFDENGNDYKVPVKTIYISEFWKELKLWYIYDGKFWKYDENCNESQEIPINVKTNQPFKKGYIGMYELERLITENNLCDLIEKSVFNKDVYHHKKTDFNCIPIRYVYKTMNYTATKKGYYDITNSKKIDKKGGASVKGMTAEHLYDYNVCDTGHKRGWRFGGITASDMLSMVETNGYIGKKMTYQECIIWILKEMDTQDFNNRPKMESKKSKKSKK